MYTLDLTGKTAIVTGGSGGLGRIITHALVDAGANVVVASRHFEACEAMAREMPSDGVLAARLDVTNRASIDNLVEQVLGRYGRIDVLINNAGISPFAAPMRNTRAEGLKKLFEVNVIGAFECAQACAPSMMSQKNGAIINVASSAAKVGIAGIGAYAISKAALVKLTEQLAGEWGPHGIRVNAIAPGFMGVGVAELVGNSEEFINPVLSRTPLGRVGTPNEIAAGVVFLASDESSYITGQTLFIDGGVSAW